MKTLLDTATASEGTCADEGDKGEHDGDEDPVDPVECKQCLERVAVSQIRVSAVLPALELCGEGTCRRRDAV